MQKVVRGGIRHVQDGYFDLLLLDHEMPGMNGLEVSREVRNPEIDIVIITAYGTIERTGVAMRRGPLLSTSRWAPPGTTTPGKTGGYPSSDRSFCKTVCQGKQQTDFRYHQ
nr:response regulator [Desulfobacterales bacterium]